MIGGKIGKRARRLAPLAAATFFLVLLGYAFPMLPARASPSGVFGCDGAEVSFIWIGGARAPFGSAGAGHAMEVWDSAHNTLIAWAATARGSLDLPDDALSVNQLMGWVYDRSLEAWVIADALTDYSAARAACAAMANGHLQPTPAPTWGGGLLDDGRLEPEPEDVYAVWCGGGLTTVYGGAPIRFLAQFPAQELLALSPQGGELHSQNELVFTRQDDTITITGSDGGSKLFTLSACLTAAGAPSGRPFNGAPVTAPTAAPARHVVQEGETLAGIARLYGLSLEALLEANPQLTDPDLLRPGQALRLP